MALLDKTSNVSLCFGVRNKYAVYWKVWAPLSLYPYASRFPSFLYHAFLLGPCVPSWLGLHSSEQSSPMLDVPFMNILILQATAWMLPVFLPCLLSTTVPLLEVHALLFPRLSQHVSPSVVIRFSVATDSSVWLQGRHHAWNMLGTACGHQILSMLWASVSFANDLLFLTLGFRAQPWGVVSTDTIDEYI